MGDQLHEIYKGVVGFILVVVTGIGWWVKRQIGRLDEHDQRLQHIEQDYARRSDIDRVIKAVKDSHYDTNKRIDRLYEQLHNER